MSARITLLEGKVKLMEAQVTQATGRGGATGRWQLCARRGGGGEVEGGTGGHEGGGGVTV